MVKRSITSRAKFSFGASRWLEPPSSQMSIDGSVESAWVRLSNVPGPMGAEDLVLAVHVDRHADLVEAGGELAVQEQRQLLAKRRGRRRHLLHPPPDEVDVLVVGVAALAGVDLLDRAEPRRPRRRALGSRETVEQLLDRLVEPRRGGGVDLGAARAEPGPTEKVRDEGAVGHRQVPPGSAAGPRGTVSVRGSSIDLPHDGDTVTGFPRRVVTMRE